MILPPPAARLPITQVPASLAAQFEGAAVRYRAVYFAALDGKIPATSENGRWYVDPADLPKIAATFGLRPRAAAQVTRTRRRSIPEAVAATA